MSAETPDLKLGTVEQETRAFIATLGDLSPKQRIHAAHAIALARNLDQADTATQPLSAVGTVSRRIVVVLDMLRSGAASGAVPDATPTPAPAGVTPIGAAVKGRAARKKAVGGRS